MVGAIAKGEGHRGAVSASPAYNIRIGQRHVRYDAGVRPVARHHDVCSVSDVIRHSRLVALRHMVIGTGDRSAGRVTAAVFGARPTPKRDFALVSLLRLTKTSATLEIDRGTGSVRKEIADGRPKTHVVTVAAERATSVGRHPQRDLSVRNLLVPSRWR